MRQALSWETDYDLSGAETPSTQGIGFPYDRLDGSGFDTTSDITQTFGDFGTPCTETTTTTPTVTLTWVPASGKTMTSDPPPKAPVSLFITAYAEGNSGIQPYADPLVSFDGSGTTANDGLGDPAVNVSYIPLQDTDMISEGDKVIERDGSSGTITVTGAALSATASGNNDDPTDWDCFAGTVFKYGVSVISANLYGYSTDQGANSGSSPGSGGPGGGGPSGGLPGSGNTDYTVPYYSGTDCQATANAAALSGFVAHAELLINGTVVKEYYDASTAPSPLPADAITGHSLPAASLSVDFDSTHFANGSTITLLLRVRDTNKGFYSTDPVSGPAVNNAFLMYNSTSSVDDPTTNINEAQPAADAVDALLPSAHIHVGAEDGGDNVAGIEGKLSNASSQYTIFFGATHTATAYSNGGYVMGDCFSNPLDESSDWLTDTNISSSVQAAAQSPSQPPYNFIYLHSCNGASGNTFDSDFGIPSSMGGDRGGVGFTSNIDYNIKYKLTPPGYVEDGELAASQQDTKYTQSVWKYLLSGETVFSAIHDAILATGGAQEWYEPTQQGQSGTLGADNTEIAEQLDGGNGLTVAGAVFDGSPGQWFK